MGPSSVEAPAPGETRGSVGDPSGLADAHGSEALVLAAGLAGPDRAGAVARSALVDLLGGSSVPDDPAARRVAVLAATVRAGTLAARDAAGSPAPPDVAARRDPLAADVRAAVAGLGPDERAALALRAVPDLPAAQAVAVLRAAGLRPPELADSTAASDIGLDRLVGRARLGVWAALHGVAREPLSDDPPPCRRALGLMTRRRDTGLAHADDRSWLDAHLSACPRCPGRRRAMGEAALAWRTRGAAAPADPTLTADVHARLQPPGRAAPLPRDRAGLRREVRRRGLAALVGAVLVGTGAVIALPGGGSRAPTPGPSRGGPGHRHGRPATAHVRLPPVRGVGRTAVRLRRLARANGLSTPSFVPRVQPIAR